VPSPSRSRPPSGRAGSASQSAVSATSARTRSRGAGLCHRGEDGRSEREEAVGERLEALRLAEVTGRADDARGGGRGIRVVDEDAAGGVGGVGGVRRVAAPPRSSRRSRSPMIVRAAATRYE
jgi:hypothetical protein